MHRDHLGKLDHRRLGGGIGHLGRAGPTNAGSRCQVDDDAAALGFHDRQHMLASQKHALQVEIDLRVPDFLAHFNRPAGSRTTDIVHQDIDPAEAVLAGSYHCRYGRTFGHVACKGLYLATGLPRTRHGFGQACGVNVGSQHARTFLRKAYCRGAAISPTRTDRACSADNGDLAGQACVVHRLIPANRSL